MDKIFLFRLIIGMLRDGYTPGKKGPFRAEPDPGRTKGMFWELYNQTCWWYMYRKNFHLKSHPTGMMNGQPRRPPSIILPIDGGVEE